MRKHEEFVFFPCISGLALVTDVWAGEQEGEHRPGPRSAPASPGPTQPMAESFTQLTLLLSWLVVGLQSHF